LTEFNDLYFTANNLFGVQMRKAVWRHTMCVTFWVGPACRDRMNGIRRIGLRYDRRFLPVIKVATMRTDSSSTSSRSLGSCQIARLTRQRHRRLICHTR